MSKDLDWGEIHNAGAIACTCDGPCCASEVDVEFEGGPDYREAQRQIECEGWFSKKIGAAWHDFCSNKCYQDFLKQHGL